MSRAPRFSLLAAVAVASTGLLALGDPSAASAADGYTVQSLHFRVEVGPTGGTVCDVVGDLYMPTDATAKDPVPALLMTNGWGGGKNDNTGIAKAFALDGYAALTYSGLGFGGSGCKIMVDDPQWDGKAASQLVSYLGGAPGVAFVDAEHTIAAPQLTSVRRDVKDHDGARRAYDPRVGMIGGSYAGGVQFAAASIDHRIDTIVPLITWNDLSYSLAPNGTTTTTGVTSGTSGAFKTIYGTGLLGLGAAGIGTGPTDAERLLGCPNLVDRFCPDILTGAATGHFSSDAAEFYRGRSVASYMSSITVPVLLAQGQKDTLFNLNEAAATYQALKAQGTPVKMMWHSWGHSNGAVGAPGEFDLLAPDLSGQYQWRRIRDWFDHYLRGTTASTGPEFSYFRDWVGYAGSAAPAYATSSSFPVGTRKPLYLSGTGGLSGSATTVAPGWQTLLTPPVGAPTSLDPLDLLTSVAAAAPTPEVDAPGTAASWTTPTLSTPLDVVGMPELTVRVDAPTAALSQATGPAGQLVLFIKLLDVAPDGTASLVEFQNTPARIADVTEPVHVTLGGIVHRFEAGHRLRLTIAGGSANFRGNTLSHPVTITAGAAQVLTLPVV